MVQQSSIASSQLQSHWFDSDLGLLSMQSFTGSFHICVGFLHVLQCPPTSQNACRWISFSEHMDKYLVYLSSACCLFNKLRRSSLQCCVLYPVFVLHQRVITPCEKLRKWKREGSSWYYLPFSLHSPAECNCLTETVIMCLHDVFICI